MLKALGWFCCDPLCASVSACLIPTSPVQTPVEEVPAAIAPFQGRVLIGVGKLLRVYDLGKKKLLRKCENKVLTFVLELRGLKGTSAELLVLHTLV